MEWPTHGGQTQPCGGAVRFVKPRAQDEFSRGAARRVAVRRKNPPRRAA